MSAERRSHPRLESNARVLWSVVGRHDLQIDRLRDVSRGGAFIDTRAIAQVGEEIRFDLLDDDGEKFGSGLARVIRVGSRGMGISFLALGIDPGLVSTLASTHPPAGRPPPLPGVIAGPPPMPVKTESLPPVSDRHVEELAPEIEPLVVRRTGVIIGIDLGTTNTCASYVVDGKPTIIPGRTGTNTIPSMITFDPDGTFHVGQRAADRQILYPLRTVYGSKRLIGRTYRADLAAELQRHFAYPIAEAVGQRFGVRIDERVVDMDTIATCVLEEVRATAEEHLGVPVEAAVITVPAYFSEVQREAVRRAARAAKLSVHRIVNEPTAAAVAYGHKQGQARARVAVWDFGGGTFDFSVVDVTNGKIEVVATGGDNFVGGSDFDDLLASHLLTEFQGQHGIDVDPTPQQIARLREAAELAKRALSVQGDYRVEVKEFTREPLRDLSVEVTRDAFDAMTRPLVDRTLSIATEVLKSISLTPRDVDDVLLVGGTTRVPAVQTAVARLFERRPSKRINPDEAVAHGAALLADEIGSGSGPTLVDILPMSVGYGAPDLVFVPVAPRYTRLPLQKDVTRKADLLGSVTLHLFQGEARDLSHDEYLCSAIVEDPSLREGDPVVIRLSFDEHCVMSVEARRGPNGAALPVKLDRGRPVKDILTELGRYAGPKVDTWRPPRSRLGEVLGRLFKIFGR